jgi:multisubunit Na+/H+ antiporter MnhF subunit
MHRQQTFSDGILVNASYTSEILLAEKASLSAILVWFLLSFHATIVFAIFLKI